MFVGMLFIYLKVTSNKSAPEVSIIHFFEAPFMKSIYSVVICTAMAHLI